MPLPIPSRLRINADDFGYDAATSLGIAQAVKEGLVDSISVMPCRDAPTVNLLRGLADAFPQLRIGVHLTLIDMPLLRSESPRYPGAKGYAQGFPAFLSWYARGGIPAAQVYQEWRRQIEWVGAMIGGASRLHHLDSHQHLHVLPGLWDVAQKLQREFSIPRLRLPYESLGKALFHRFPFGFIFQLLVACRHWQDRRRPPAFSGALRERFYGFFRSTRFDFAAYRSVLEKALSSQQDCELMVHPIVEDGQERLAPYSNERRQEMQELRKLRAWLAVVETRSSPKSVPVR